MLQTKDAAQACLAAGQEGNLVLRSTVVETQPAVSREDLHKDPKKRSDSKRDGRNLYLIKEGGEFKAITSSLNTLYILS